MKDKRLLIAVLAQLEQEGAVSIPQLAGLLNVSEDDVFEALELLVFAYDAASIRLDLHDAYATLFDPGVKRILRLTAPEADALIDALMSAGFSPESELVRTLLDAKGVLNDAEGTAAPRMQVVGSAPDPRVVQTIALACEDERHPLLEIAYQGIDDDASRTRVVEPVGIISAGAHRYLNAYCRSAGGWRSFRLDRIAAASILDDCFEPRPDSPAAGSALIRGGVRAKLSIAAGCLLPQWAGLRVIQRDDDGSRVATISWTESSWLPRHIIALGGSVLPLGPQELVDACRELAASMLEDA